MIRAHPPRGIRSDRPAYPSRPTRAKIATLKRKGVDQMNPDTTSNPEALARSSRRVCSWGIVYHGR
jgi:hypothetical protein